jgi:hypothetical protein
MTIRSIPLLLHRDKILRQGIDSNNPNPSRVPKPLTSNTIPIHEENGNQNTQRTEKNQRESHKQINNK